MATNLLPLQPLAVSGHRKTSAAGTRTNTNWWTPLFSWSSNPDYINIKKKEDRANVDLRSEKNPARFAPGCFTEEKAKQLRMKMAVESGTFHDVMYHSAIASRLASDFSRPSDGQ